MLKQLRWIIEYLLISIPCFLLRFEPWWMMRGTAWFFGFALHLIPPARNLVRANIRAAMPELSEADVRRIARRSFDNLMWNLTEYIWLIGKEKRIRRCYEVPPDTLKFFQEKVRKKEQVIFVTPHLGSWEASGLMSPFYAGMKLAAIAKPVRNPYLNKLLNSGNRESTPGLKIIFSKGAMRASLQALREGWSIGTLIDQNTKERDGGIFVDFFGLPVPTSTAPAMLKSYCDQKKIPCEIFLACSLRDREGRIISRAVPLKKKFDEYASHKEIIQELMKTSEEIIRQHPDQYLWMYKRFQYIPDDASPEQINRYPRYAKRPGKKFYKSVRVKSSGAADHGEPGA